jgi:hypothetical protein
MSVATATRFATRPDRHFKTIDFLTLLDSDARRRWRASAFWIDRRVQPV